MDFLEEKKCHSCDSTWQKYDKSWKEISRIKTLKKDFGETTFWRGKKDRDFNWEFHSPKTMSIEALSVSVRFEKNLSLLHYNCPFSKRKPVTPKCFKKQFTTKKVYPKPKMMVFFKGKILEGDPSRINASILTLESWNHHPNIHLCTYWKPWTSASACREEGSYRPLCKM